MDANQTVSATVLLQIADRLTTARDRFDGENIDGASVYYTVMSEIGEIIRSEVRLASQKLILK
jgi:hypothetical protein